MRIIFKVLGLAVVITSMLAVALAGNALAAGPIEPAGPAPNSGDGIHDGSGFDGPYGPYGSVEL